MEFYFRKDSGKYRTECMVCQSDNAKRRYTENRDKNRKQQSTSYKKHRTKRLAYSKAYNEINKEKIAEWSLGYRACNKDKIAASKKKYVQENPDKVAAYQRKYREEHREELREKTRVCRAQRRKNDPAYRLLQNCRKRVYDALGGKCKSARTMELVGCTIEQLKEHLESRFQPGMTWDNYGRGGWSVDHIIPCASFDLATVEQQQTCFHYTNTQPLWEDDNIKKSDSTA